MFETKLTRRPMNAHDRASWAASMGTAILLHAGLVALLLYFVRPPELVPSAGEVASWFDLGFSVPGGGGEVSDQAPGPGAPEAPVPPEVEPPDALSLAVPDAPADTVRPDSLDSPTEGEEAAPVVASGAGTTSGAGGQGGTGGGAGGGSGGGIGPGQGEGIGGRGGPTQPLHLVVPRIPRGVSPRAARGRSVLLLVEVRGNGSVGEARIDRPSGIAALDDAALAAARGMRYRSRADTMPQWTRLEIRF